MTGFLESLNGLAGAFMVAFGGLIALTVLVATAWHNYKVRKLLRQIELNTRGKA